MKEFTICQTYESWNKIKCDKIEVDRDGILLAFVEGERIVAMFKEWAYWIEDDYEVGDE